MARRRGQKRPDPDRILTRRRALLAVGVLAAVWVIVFATLGVNARISLGLPTVALVATAAVAVLAAVLFTWLIYWTVLTWIASKIMRFDDASFRNAFRAVIVRIAVTLACGAALVLLLAATVGPMAYFGWGEPERTAVQCVAVAVLICAAAVVANTLLIIRAVKRVYGVGFWAAAGLNFVIFLINIFVHFGASVASAAVQCAMLNVFAAG